VEIGARTELETGVYQYINWFYTHSFSSSNFGDMICEERLLRKPKYVDPQSVGDGDFSRVITHPKDEGGFVVKLRSGLPVGGKLECREQWYLYAVKATSHVAVHEAETVKHC